MDDARRALELGVLRKTWTEILDVIESLQNRLQKAEKRIKEVNLEWFPPEVIPGNGNEILFVTKRGKTRVGMVEVNKAETKVYFNKNNVSWNNVTTWIYLSSVLKAIREVPPF
jgi:hypothetical protein